MKDSKSETPRPQVADKANEKIPQQPHSYRLRVDVLNALSDLSAYYTERGDNRRYGVNKAWHLIHNLP